MSPEMCGFLVASLAIADGSTLEMLLISIDRLGRNLVEGDCSEGLRMVCLIGEESQYVLSWAMTL